MFKHSRSVMALAACGVVLGGALISVPSAQAQSRRDSRRDARSLEVWPGQRVVLVLPVDLGTDFGDAQLGQAVLPLIEPLVPRALTGTDKFSVTTPYRFDPILRRAVVENRISEEEVTALINSPTLATGQAVLGKLIFDQPAMIAQVTLEELRVGGTPKRPTVQVQMSGRLTEVGGGLFRSVTVTSKPFAGRTPEARIQDAARDALQELAMQLVAPPESFALPLPAPTVPGANVAGANAANAAGANAGGANAGAAPPVPAPATPAPTAPTRVTPGAPVTAPNAISPARGESFVPVLPPAQPPLGIQVPQEPTVG